MIEINEDFDGPEEASAGMRTMARSMRDMYVALIAEGFTDREALTMVGQVLITAMTITKNNGD